MEVCDLRRGGFDSGNCNLMNDTLGIYTTIGYWKHHCVFDLVTHKFISEKWVFYLNHPN